MKKYRSLFVLAATTFALVLTGCGGETPVYKLTVQQDSGVEKVQIFEGDTEVTDLTRIEEGTELSAVITLKEDYETTAVKFEGETLTAVSGAYDFVMPAKDATFEVTTKAVEEVPVVETFALTVNKDQGVDSVKIMAGTTEVNDTTSIAEGTELTLEVVAKDGHSISEVTLDGKALTVGADGKYSFEMPSKDATVSIKTVKTINYFTLTVTKDAHVNSVDVYQGETKVADLIKIAEGAALSAVVTVEPGFEIASVKLGDTVLTASEGRYAFTMPSANATLAVVTKEVKVASTITVSNDATKGSVDLKVNDAAYNAQACYVGDTAKVVVNTVSANVKVKSLTVNGTEVPYEATGYSFVITEVTNTIVVNYAEKHALTFEMLNDPANREFFVPTVKVNNEIVSSTASVFEGDKVDVEVAVSASMSANLSSFLSDIYLHVNDEVILGDEGVFDTEANKVTMSFEMPANDTDVKLAYGQGRVTGEEEGVNVTFAANEHLKVYAYDKDSKYAKSREGKTFILVREAGYEIDSLVLTYADDASETISNQYELPNFEGNVAKLMLHKELAQDVTISFVGSVKEVNTITYVNSESVKAASGDLPTTVTEGRTATAWSISSTESDKYISEIKVTGLEEGEYTLENIGEGSWNLAINGVGKDVTVEFVLSAKGALIVEENELLEKFLFSTRAYSVSEITHAAPGQLIYLMVTPKTGYLLGNATISGVEGVFTPTRANGDYSYYYSLRMPESGDLRVSVAVSQARNVSVDEETKSMVSTNFTSGTSFAAGSTVTFTYNVTDSKKLVEEVYLENTAGERLDIEITETDFYGTTRYNFIMPDYDVVVCYTVVNKAVSKPQLNLTNSSGNEAAVTNIMVSSTDVAINGFYDEEKNPTGFQSGMTADFFESENVSVHVTLAAGYEASLSYTYNDTEEKPVTKAVSVADISSGTYRFTSFAVPKNLTSIDIVVKEAQALEAEIKYDESLTVEEFKNLTFEYTVNGEAADNFSKVYAGDEINFAITSEAESGYVYQFTIADGEGNPISPNYSGNYKVVDKFVITVSKVEAYSFTFTNNTDAYVIINFQYGSGTLREDGLIYGGETTGSINVTYCNVPFSYEVRVNGVVVDSGEVTESNYGGYMGSTNEFTINGNVEFIMNPIE